MLGGAAGVLLESLAELCAILADLDRTLWRSCSTAKVALAHSRKHSIGQSRKLPRSRTAPERSRALTVATTSRSSDVSSPTLETSATSVVSITSTSHRFL